MGRQKKIKAVDPFASTTRKAALSQDSGKWNNPPKMREQKASKVHMLMLESMKSMKQAKQKKDTVKKRAETNLENNLMKKPGENNERYIRRLNNEAYTLLAATRMQERIKGNTEFLPPKKGMSEKKRERLNKKKEKMKKKRKDSEIRQKEKELFTDHVKFGEVSMKPPETLAKPRNSQETDGKPGRRNLLLKNILSPPNLSSSGSVKTKSIHAPKFSKSKQIRHIKKRKNMSESEKRQFDAAQTEAIMAYRKVKLTKMNKKEEKNKPVKDMNIF